MQDYTLEQLLTTFANAQREHDFAHTAEKMVDVKRREELAKARMNAVIAELQRRIDEEKAA
jgi:hypothetical protein